MVVFFQVRGQPARMLVLAPEFGGVFRAGSLGEGLAAGHPLGTCPAPGLRGRYCPFVEEGRGQAQDLLGLLPPRRGQDRRLGPPARAVAVAVGRQEAIEQAAKLRRAGDLGQAPLDARLGVRHQRRHPRRCAGRAGQLVQLVEQPGQDALLALQELERGRLGLCAVQP